MSAWVVTDQIQPGKMDERFALVRVTVVPAPQQVDGFSGFVARIDRDYGRASAPACGNSSEALAASEHSGNYRAQADEFSGVPAGASERQTFEIVVVA